MSLLYGFLIGSLMGLLTHAKRNGKIIKPYNKKRVFEYGFLLDLVFGGVAAIAIVTLTDPTTVEQLIFTSVLAGYGGDTLIAKLEEAKLSDVLNQLFFQVEIELNAELTVETQSQVHS
ncbi:MAG TPA: DUF4257 domain-containing protein [Bacillus sp. (in: firmicutes)]|uniref:DUF4257 domain-containing protein n=1 Tax=Bacillus litorisediminis TaxID=2922713 RepID=UPI001FAE60C8|nr:DUF4257 domain-containing protein [Bacillus litorisediminis]HWO76698.1 DUF4257 domain-containing protein [Bacillus sp. (in: firmicutes)]